MLDKIIAMLEYPNRIKKAKETAKRKLKRQASGLFLIKKHKTAYIVVLNPQHKMVTECHMELSDFSPYNSASLGTMWFPTESDAAGELDRRFEVFAGIYVNNRLRGIKKNNLYGLPVSYP